MKRLLLALVAFFLSLPLFSQDLVVIESKNLHCNDSILVFIPEKYQSNYSDTYCVECCGDPDPVPALFLLHGWSGCFRDWSRKCDIQAVADRYGFIIICPDGFYDSWYVNAEGPDGMQWRDFFRKELYPQIKEKYFLDAEKTFITGLSMGGHGAINLFLDNTSRFKAAGSMSGVLDLNYEKGRLGLSSLLGEYVPENNRHNDESAVNRVERAKDSGKIMLVTCGQDDILLGASKDFAARCKQQGIHCIEVYSPGNHTWTYWDYALHLHLWYFTRILNGDNLGWN